MDYIPPELLPADLLTGTAGTSSKNIKKLQSKSASIKDKKEEYEKEMILKALQNNKWNQSITAADLGLPESTLRYKMRKLRINKE
jgi:DNA-binding NtrC family response regulator